MSSGNIHLSLFKNPVIRLVFFVTMIAAFIFGYMDHLFPGNFERLHIFLFNLTTGGTIILYFTENRPIPGWKPVTFFLGSIVFAVLAFLELYLAAAMISLPLALIAELIRINTFSFFPVDFFRRHVDVARKFHHAALLCLSMALVISSVVIINNTQTHWFYFEKLRLNVFFLGFSFPVSLITLSIIFTFINKSSSKLYLEIQDLFFWLINLGVILFFLFIIFEWMIPEAMAALTLSLTVIGILYFFFHNGLTIQQNLILKSGAFFLLSTAITGVLYIVVKVLPVDIYRSGETILTIHSYLSLYGWNLSGLLVIIRWNDFPLRLNTKWFIAFHWITILILPPLAQGSLAFAVLSIASYMILLAFVFHRVPRLRIF
jgi:hypothetical protein